MSSVARPAPTPAVEFGEVVAHLGFAFVAKFVGEFVAALGFGIVVVGRWGAVVHGF